MIKYRYFQKMGENEMKIKKLDAVFSICKLADFSNVDRDALYCFTARTEDEYSLLCPSAQVPELVLAREDGWRGFRIEGALDFSLIGILSRITTLLAEQKIGIFAVSTYDTDYIFTREAQFQKALDVLTENGYELV